MDRNKIIKMTLDSLMGDRYGRYAKYIIQDRALPNAKDGLKPVQRRILYAMNDLGLTYDRAFKKSARVVGEVIGKYHPHGDTSVYDAMVRMAQEWKVNHPLVEMHGNKGSVDGDSPAAMRYTETRLSPISALLLEDLEKDTVDFAPNFDDSETEPMVLPGRFPNLLVNGTTGIASGYATNMPPHNLGEVCDALIERVDNPECDLDSLMQVIHGPDFPTGGIIQGEKGIRDAFETGKGRITIKSKWHWTEARKGIKSMIITEIPYEANKSDLVRKLAEIAYEKVIPEIKEVRDETDRTGLRIAIECKKDADESLIEKLFMKKTPLLVSYSINNVTIINKKPIQAPLIRLLDAYIEHQKEVILRMATYLYDKSIKRQEIVEGIAKAISSVDRVIEIIRHSKNKDSAKKELISEFDFTEIQAEAIVQLRLYRLTSTDVSELEKEIKRLKDQIEKLDVLMNSDKARRKAIKSKLRRIKLEFGVDRRSPIDGEIENLVITEKDLIKEEEVFIAISKEGYIKRVPTRSYGSSKFDDIGLKDGDTLINSIKTNTTNTLLVFTNLGNYVFMPIHKIKEFKWKEVGSHINEYVTILPEEHVVYAVTVEDFERTEEKLMISTKQGLIKQVKVSDLHVSRDSKVYPFIKFKAEDDSIASLEIVRNNQFVFLATQSGLASRYLVDDVSIVGTRASGVKSVTLDGKDLVAGITLCSNDDDVVFVSSNRGVKRIYCDKIPLTKRGVKGVTLLKQFKTNPIMVNNIVKCLHDDEIILETTEGHEIIKPKVVNITNTSTSVSSVTKGMIVNSFKRFKTSGVTIKATEVIQSEEEPEERIMEDGQQAKLEI